MINCSIDRINKFIEDISKFTESDRPYTRQSLSDEDMDAKAYVIDRMKALGLHVVMDWAGNIFGMEQDLEPDTPTIMMGSHLDTVLSGGRYDGVMGVACAIEVVTTIKENNLQPVMPITIVIYEEEEGATFDYALMGSRYMNKELSIDTIQSLTNNDGVTFKECYEKTDILDIEKAERVELNIQRIYEVHCEQASVLESTNTSLGIVDSIYGMSGYMVNIEGIADHAGATPMNQRKYNVEAMAKVILALNTYVMENTKQTVATIGQIELTPGSSNVIPNNAFFTMDIRSPNAEELAATKKYIEDFIQDTCADMELNYSINKTHDKMPIHMSRELNNMLKSSAVKRGYSHMDISSAAGHDIMVFTDYTKALVFVPNKDGKSHCPEEYSKPEDILAAFNIVLDTVIGD